MKKILFVIFTILSINLFSYQMNDLEENRLYGDIFQLHEVYYENGIINMIKFREFNKQGNLTYEINNFNIHGGNLLSFSLDLHYTYIYNEYGFMKRYVRSSHYSEEFDEVTKSSFDQSGNEIKRIIYDNGSNGLKKQTEYIFGYDDANRIISYSEITYDYFDESIYRNDLNTYTYCDNGDIDKSIQYNGKYSKVGYVDVLTYDKNHKLINHKEVKPNGDVVSDKKIIVNNNYFEYKGAKYQYDNKYNVIKVIENGNVTMERKIVYYDDDIEKYYYRDDKCEEKHFK